MVKRNCALSFLYNFFVTGHVYVNNFLIYDRRQYVLQTGLVNSVFDRVDALQNDQTLFCYFRHGNPVQHVYIVKIPLIRLSNCFGPEKHLFPRSHDFAKMNEFKLFCNWPLALASLTSLDSLTTIEIQF